MIFRFLVVEVNLIETVPLLHSLLSIYFTGLRIVHVQLTGVLVKFLDAAHLLVE